MNKSKQINDLLEFLEWYKSSNMLIKYLPPPESFPCIVVWHKQSNSYEIVYLSDFNK